MAQVVQARCPGCKQVLRIPAEWVNTSMRCKHCGMVIQARPRPAAVKTNGTAPPSPAAPTRASSPPAAPSTAPAQVAVAPDPMPAGSFLAGVSESHGADDSPFGLPENAASPVTLRYRRGGKGKGRGPVLMAVMLLLVGVPAAVLSFNSGLRQRLLASINGSDSEPDSVSPSKGKKGKPGDLPVTAAEFPRRLLAISVNNYLYANPVSYGYLEEGKEETQKIRGKKPDRSVSAVLTRLGEAWHVSVSQRLELSDSAIKGTARAPIKSAIQDTVTEFLNSSRAQDRIAIIFVGHAVAIGDEGYLVPIEGELEVKETLVPLKWLFDAMKNCKARQKVLIMDVCRFDPSHGLERPGSGPMSEKLEAALKNPPEGVEVWVACSAKQFSYEGYLDVANNIVALNGGFFLDQLYEAVGPNAAKKVPVGIQHPEDPLPLEILAKGKGKIPGVNRGTEQQAQDVYQDKQTPWLTGHEPADGAAYNPDEGMPEKLALKDPPPPSGGLAPKALVAGILKEIEAIPPVKINQAEIQPLNADTLPPLSAKVMAAYKDDGAETPLREAVKKTIKQLSDPKIAKAFNERFTGSGNDVAIKKIIQEQQRQPAIIQSELETALEELQEAGKDYKEEPSKRWRANYNYALARLLERIAYVYEYNYMLGQIRKDALPARDPAIHTGWVLVSREKFQSGTEARKKAELAKKTLTKLIKENKGTPWEILAKRESMTALGLQWKPTR